MQSTTVRYKRLDKHWEKVAYDYLLSSCHTLPALYTLLSELGEQHRILYYTLIDEQA